MGEPGFVFDFRLRLRLRRDKSPWQAADNVSQRGAPRGRRRRGACHPDRSGGVSSWAVAVHSAFRVLPAVSPARRGRRRVRVPRWRGRTAGQWLWNYVDGWRGKSGQEKWYCGSRSLRSLRSLSARLSQRASQLWAQKACCIGATLAHLSCLRYNRKLIAPTCSGCPALPQDGPAYPSGRG